ncbi:MAG: TetR family transcriptional regulator [Anaerolineae bacterium]|nr:TetR family transcriptional regulator [Anaerolineae bacterium]
MPKTRDKLTFIEEARRKQIVEAAIETIANEGYINASLAEIAKYADISKGVISYHFDNKDDLIDETINTILSDSYRYIREQVKAANEAMNDRLAAYITASFNYMAENRTQFVAMVDLWGSFSSFERKKQYNHAAYDPCRRHLLDILEPGQAAGELGAFPARTLASIIQAAIDGIMLQWVFDPDSVDFEECKQEIIRIFEVYTRNQT